MKNHFGRFTFIALIAAVCVWLTWSKGIKLGLDLEGGSSLTYAVRADGTIDNARLAKAIEVITKRVNATGLTEIYITSTANNEIVVEMPRRTKEEIGGIKSLIERNGQLEFRIREDSATEKTERELKEANPVLYRTPPDRAWIPWNAEELKSGKARDAEILVKVPEAPLRAKWAALKASKGEDAPETRQALRELGDAEASEWFRGEDLDKTGLTTQGASIVVEFKFKDPRMNDFGSFTKRNVGKQMAIILDGKVSSDPVIRSELPGRGIIEGGGGNGFTETEANELRITLESGSTGVHLDLTREETLGASLGEVAIERGKWSVGIGFLVVFIVVLWWYRLPGLVANLALLLNVLIILGALAFFRGALSLPGIAGIVLTVGMAVDANILIFERLRDERKRGRNLHESLASGYDRAMSAIIDSNVTTILTALVLIALGTGAVRGFGVTLTIGLMASMFTAIWVTRAVFEWAIDRKLLTNFDIGKDPKDPAIDYMKHRLWFTGPSLVFMVLGTIGFLVRDEADSKDLEFIGGQQVIVQLNKAIGAAEMDSYAKGPNGEWFDAGSVPLAPEGVEAAPKTTNRWQIRVKADSEAKGEVYVESLRTRLAGLFVPAGYEGWSETPAVAGGKPRTGFTLHTLAPLGDIEDLKKQLAIQQVGGVTIEKPAGGDGRAHLVSIDTEDGGETVVKEKFRKALMGMAAPVHLSDPTPSVSYLSPVQAEKLWRTALEAVLISLIIQVIYLRLRFLDYKHGFGAVLALIHDVTITLGAVALFDGLGLVYAKVNLVLIAAFLTLIGFSMNDTIVVFDRMRENLGRGKVMRARIINDSINQTLVRSIRTTVTTWLVVVVQFAFNRDLGSVLEGFAFVMVVGCIAGSYSSIFMAAPVLLFLPGYGKKLLGNKPIAVVMFVAAIVGTIMAVATKGHGGTFWAGIGLASLIPIHFLVHFVPWLMHPDPDSLVDDEDEAAKEDLPLHSPGV